MAVLHAVEGPLRGQKFSIPSRPKLIVGRYEVYDLIVPDPSISRKHFAFERRTDGLYLIDLGSLNGTQLNGLRVSTAKVEHGDRITAGQTVLLYDESDSPTAPDIEPRGEVVAPVENEIEVVSDDDILQDGPISLDLPTPPPAPAPASAESSSDIGRRVTERLVAAKPSSKGKSARKTAGAGQSDECAACGRPVPREEVDGGEGANTRLGYVCGRCVERRQKSGQKGPLEKFIRERQRRRL